VKCYGCFSPLRKTLGKKFPGENNDIDYGFTMVKNSSARHYKFFNKGLIFVIGYKVYSIKEA